MSDEPNCEAAMTVKMRDIRCVSMDFELEVPFDKFDLTAFKRELGPSAETKREARVCNTANPASADYHVHFSWRVIEDKAVLLFKLEYVAKITTPSEDEKPPFAED